jgi:hypothetical protein
MTWRIPKDVMTAHLAGEAVILHLGTKAYFKLNDTAAVAWKGIEAGDGEDEVVARLVGAFEVTPAEARDGLRTLVGELRSRGLLAP